MRRERVDRAVASTASALDRLALPPSVDKTSVQEFLIHIHSFLQKTGFNNVAEQLQSELEKSGHIPARYTIDGGRRSQTLAQFLNQHGTFSTDLLQMLSSMHQLSDAQFPPITRGLNLRLYASQRTSLLRRNTVVRHAFATKITTHRPPVDALNTCNFTNVLKAREFGVRIPTQLLQRSSTMTEEHLNNHGVFHGHLVHCFCVTYDQTGRYIFTGSDDKLIKVWDTATGRLRHTFRGCTDAVCDISINMENTCIACGSTDKIVRTWRLNTGEPAMIHKKHQAIINVVRFLPFAQDKHRWLVSTGNDCQVIFYRYDINTLIFDKDPYQFEEREMPGARMLSATHSAGGNFVVMGDSAHFVHIYMLTADGVQRIHEFKAHNDYVDSLAWANQRLSFASGSKDGTAKIWTLKAGTWDALELRVNEPPSAANAQAATQNTVSRRVNPYKVSSLNWTSDDEHLITAGSDFVVRVWNAKTGEQRRTLVGHSAIAFCVSPHTIHSNLVFTAAHDGLIILWNILTGEQQWSHRNYEESLSAAIAIYDCALAPQGDRFAFVDQRGVLSVWGVGANERARNQMRQQFYDNDYAPLQMDSNGWAFDHDGELAHRSAPPMLVNIDFHPYGPDVQRTVPGRDYADLTRIETPWSETRHIVPPLSRGELALRSAERDLFSIRELGDYEASIPTSSEEQERRRRAAQEARRLEREQKMNQLRTRRQRALQLRNDRLAEQDRYMMRPRYVIDESWTDTEDHDYSAGETSGANAETSHDSATTPEAHSDAESDEDDDWLDNFDSDYEVGRQETVTVHRTRSSTTVTGRRKRPRAVIVEQSPSPQAPETPPPQYRRSTRVKRATTRFSSTSPQRRRMSKRICRRVTYGENSDNSNC